MLPVTRPCFVLLGRYGDLIQMFPCFLAVYERTGVKPRVVVSHEYASLFDGISYSDPCPIRAHWWQGVPEARALAQTLSEGVVVPQWWNDDPAHTAMLNEATKGNFTLQCHGNKWGVDIAKWPDYGSSMASRAGFTREEWLALPLVFDRRSPGREEELYKSVAGRETRPIILYNFTGNSSPFPWVPEVVNQMKTAIGRRAAFVDLGKVRASRLYDLLGLYDRAAGLLTGDTSTLHLAQASRVPYVGFTVDGWTSSIPKGNCVLHLKYSQVPGNIAKVIDTLEGWLP